MQTHSLRPLALLAVASVALGGWSQAAAVASSTAAALPPLPDVPEYRDNVTANGVDPGPGPTGSPELAWHADVGQLHMVPILVNGLLIVGTNDGRLVALDGYTGTTVWDSPIGAGPIGVSLAADHGLVFATDGASLHAVDVGSGSEKWSAPAVDDVGRLIVDDGVVYEGTIGGVVGFDELTGKEAWRWSGGPTDIAVGAGPIADGTGYFATRDGRVFAVGLHGGDVKWSIKTISTNIASGQVVGNTLFISNNNGDTDQPVGEIYAVDRATGEIRWRFRAPSGLQLKEGPFKDGVLYANGTDDGIWALRDDGSSATVLWHVAAPPSHWPMKLVGDALYMVRTDGSAGAYSTSDGSLLWETDPLNEWGNGPIVSGGMVFVANDTHGVMAFAGPGLISKLPARATVAPSPQATNDQSVHNPFTQIASYPLAFPCGSRLSNCKQPVELGAAVGPDGLLYVLDSTPRVAVINPDDGSIVRSWGSQGSDRGQFDLRRVDDNPGNGGIDVAPDGRVFVGDGSNSRVEVFNPDGTFIAQFGSFGTGPGQSAEINQLILGHDGSVYLLIDDGRYVSSFTGDGKFRWDTRSRGNMPLDGMAGLVQRSDGMLLVSCGLCGHLLVLSPDDGHIVDEVPLHEIGTDYGPMSFDPSGNLYITLFGSGPVVDGHNVSGATLVFDPDGRFVGGHYLDPATISNNGYGQQYWPAPIFLPDGRAFSFTRDDGLIELTVELPAS